MEFLGQMSSDGGLVLVHDRAKTHGKAGTWVLEHEAAINVIKAPPRSPDLMPLDYYRFGLAKRQHRKQVAPGMGGLPVPNSSWTSCNRSPSMQQLLPTVRGCSAAWIWPAIAWRRCDMGLVAPCTAPATSMQRSHLDRSRCQEPKSRFLKVADRHSVRWNGATWPVSCMYQV